MLFSSLRRPAVAFAALVALIAAPLIYTPTAGAADPVRSSSAVDDVRDDTVIAGTTTKIVAPKADITAASARFQNDFVTLTMKLVEGDDLSNSNSLLYWVLQSGEGPGGGFVSLKKGANGLQVLVTNNPTT